MKIEIFGTPACTYCNKARQLCESKQLNYSYTNVKASPDILRALERRVGAAVKTVPQIFIDGEHLVDGFNSLFSRLSATLKA